MADTEILDRLRQYDIFPNERLGQHILIDPGWLEYIANFAYPGAHVIEIGAGPGNLTERIAARAGSVTAIELDEQYERILSDVVQRHANVSVIFGDALYVDYEALRPDSYQQLQVIANPPYHIAEPFMAILLELPIHDAVLMVGDKLSATLSATDPRRPDFTRLSLLAMGFFDVGIHARIPKSAFYPPPRTESYIIGLTPKDKIEIANPAVHIVRQLFLKANDTSVGNVIQSALQNRGGRDSLLPKRDRNRYQRREINRWLQAARKRYDTSGGQDEEALIYSTPLSRFKIPQQILSSRFFSLNNNDLQVLTNAILEVFPD